MRAKIKIRLRLGLKLRLGLGLGLGWVTCRVRARAKIRIRAKVRAWGKIGVTVWADKPVDNLSPVHSPTGETHHMFHCTVLSHNECVSGSQFRGFWEAREEERLTSTAERAN